MNEKVYWINSALVGFILIVVISFCPMVVESSEVAVDPILTRPAVLADSLSIIANARYFKNVKLEEADRFTGRGYDVEVALPFKGSMQFRLVLPAYTRGRARLINPPTLEQISIKGPAGTFDFPTILFDHQFLHREESGLNVSYFLGFGKSIRTWGKLDTTHGDIYNHQGNLFRLGIHADGYVQDTNVRWLANLGLRKYAGSDDLNPAETGDSFLLIDLMTAAVFNSWRGWFYPAIELVYQGDVDRYNALHLVPQVIVSMNDLVDLKVGTLINLSGHGEDVGARLQIGWKN